MSTDLSTLTLTVPQTGSIETYIQAVSGINMLTADEERGLAERLQQDDDLQAARKLIMSHLRFVVHIAKSYSGLWFTSSRFDPRRQHRFDESS